MFAIHRLLCRVGWHTWALYKWDRDMGAMWNVCTWCRKVVQVQPSAPRQLTPE